MPVATTANSEYSPRATLKPANRNVDSDGIGMHALSATISRKIPGRPIASMTSTANSTSGSVMEASTSKGAQGRRRRYVVDVRRGSMRGSVSDVMRCFARGCTGCATPVLGRSIFRIMIA